MRMSPPIYSAKAAKSEAPRTAARDPTTPTEAARAGAAPDVLEADAPVPVVVLAADLVIEPEPEVVPDLDADAEIVAAGALA